MHSPDYHIHNMDDNYPDTLGFQDQDFFHFQASDFFQNNQWMDEDSLPPFPAGYNAQHLSYTPHEVIAADNNPAAIGNTSFQQGLNYSRNDGRQMIQRTDKVAFKTKSEVEILDDGFKWRKYGKKMVKNSPNPRNYYKCSVEGCPVKKRVERDTEDARYVVTTYEGIHNHEVPLV